jgi:beta-N-acetylhexosaminidase
MLGPLIVGIKGKALTAEDKKLLKQPLIGGVILFARNYETIAQVRTLIAEIKALREPVLLVTVDQEGGRVQRFINEFTRLPAIGTLGVDYKKNPTETIQKTYETGFCMAKELLAVGVDLSFAPVIDLNKERQILIGDRSFHRDTSIVTVLAKAWCDGVHSAGMKTCGKHFPGHGDVVVDSHEGLPVDTRDYKTIAEDDLIPFIELINTNSLDSIMSAHIVFPAVDAEPASFSKKWQQEILRQQCHFKGILISDDLGMGGAVGMGTYQQRLEKTLVNGCDLTLLCNEHEAIAELAYNPKLEMIIDCSDKIAALYGAN